MQFSWNWRAISFQTLPLIFAQLAVTQWVSHKFYLHSLWNICVSWGPLRFCVHILFSLGLDFILLTRFAKNTFDHLIFNFALPFWEHCALLFWNCDSLPLLYHYALAEWVSNFPCSIKGFPSYRGLIWFSCGLGGGFSWNWRAILFQTLPWYLFNLQWAPHKFYAGS